WTGELTVQEAAPAGSISSLRVDSGGWVSAVLVGSNLDAKSWRYKVNKTAYDEDPSGSTLVLDNRRTKMCSSCPEGWTNGYLTNVIQLEGPHETAYLTAWP